MQVKCRSPFEKNEWGRKEEMFEEEGYSETIIENATSGGDI